MRNYATYKIVWNRKGQLGAALVQIEILLPDGKQKYVGTGLKVTASEWDAKQRQITGPFATRLNNQIAEKIAKIRAHELTLIEKNIRLTANEVNIALEVVDAGSFVAFMRVQAAARKNITNGTRSLHLRVADRLEKHGIIRFTDLTYLNIVSFDQFISKELKAQPSRYKHHQVVKCYINMATKAQIIDYYSNPYLNFNSVKGKHKIRTRLDDNEIEALIKKPASVTRDCAVFQLFTGITHKDLEQLTKNNLRRDGSDVWLEGLRKKSGEMYTIYLLPEAVEIIDRYAGHDKLIPCRDLWAYNRDLKLLAARCGISKELSTYVLRHTAATWMLRKGVPITTISSILGHNKIETTLIYARLEKQIMKEQMISAFAKPLENKPRNSEQVQPEQS
ncbi:MAG: tyrosine-type recombinase/integrase [Bacteroidota bacterium]